METPFSSEAPVGETGDEDVLSGSEDVVVVVVVVTGSSDGGVGDGAVFVGVSSTWTEKKREVEARRRRLKNHLSDPVPKWASEIALVNINSERKPRNSFFNNGGEMGPSQSAETMNKKKHRERERERVFIKERESGRRGNVREREREVARMCVKFVFVMI